MTLSAQDLRDASFLSAAVYDENSIANVGNGYTLLSRDQMGLAGAEYDNHFQNNYLYDFGFAQGFIARNGSTLSIVFRGTNSPGDLVTDIFSETGFRQHYCRFQALINALDSLLDQSVTKVLVTGHSLGGAMVEKFMATHPQDVRFVGITFGSPGTTTSSSQDSRLINVGHSGDSVYRVVDKNGVLESDLAVDLPTVRDMVELTLQNAPLIFTNYSEHQMRYYERTVNELSYSIFFNRIMGAKKDYQIFSEGAVGEENYLVGTGGDVADLLLGGSANDTLLGLSGDDLLDGGTESDALFGGRGNDRLSGGLSGNDTLEGGADSDELYGGIQNDTYVYRIGDGNDFINEQNRGGADILRIHGGEIIKFNTDLKFQRDASGALFVILRNSSGSEIGRITIANMDETGSQIETLEIVTTGITRKYDLTREGLPTTPDPDPPPPPLPAINHAPVITALGNVVALGATIDVRSMFKAVDPDAGDQITEYLFVDPVGGGQLQRNGIAVAPGTIITVSAAELQSGVLRYQGGPEGNLEAIRISAFDGQVWGAAVDSYVMSYTLPSSTTANTAPVAQDDAFSVIAGTRTLIPVLANDTDANGDPLRIVSLAGHDPRLVSIAPDGRSLIIDVPGSMSWPFRFTYYVSDGRGGQSEANATITVNPASNTNSAPVAFDLSWTGQAGSDLIIDLLQAVKDPDLGDTLTVTWVGNLLNGTLIRNGSTVTYRPATGYVGTDSVNFSVTDNHGAVNTFALSLTINGGVEAVDDFVSTEFNQAVTFNPLTNDRDDGALFVQNVSLVQHGSVAINADGTLTYTPTSGFVGTDRFRYLASDGNGGSQEAFITVAVRAANGTGGTITGSEGDDPALVGTPVGEVILGLGGNDVISPGAGNDNIDGGADFDTVDYSSSPSGIVIDASDTPFITQNGTEIPDESQDGFGSIDLIKNIEGIIGSAWNDRLIGGDRFNRIVGGAGDDEILGSYSASQIGDEIDGGDGNDIINLSILNNRVYGGSGNDQILGGIPGSTNGVPNLAWGAANNWVDAGDGNDRIVLWGTGNTVFGGDGNDTIRTGGYVDAGAGDDVVTEYATSNFSVQFANDEWHLGAGNDRAVISIGADRVFGDDGDDTIIYERPAGVADLGADVFDGGSGFDTFRFSLTAADSPTRVFIDLAAGFARFSDGTYFQVTNFERFDEWFGDADVLGSARADEVRVADGNGVIEGRGGADRLIASSGGFTFIGGEGADFIDPGHDSSTNNGARFWGTVDRIVYNSVFDAGDQIAATFATGSGGDVVAVSGLLSSIGYGGSTPFTDGYLRLIASGSGAQFQVDTDGNGARETWTTLATFADDAFSFTAANFDVGDAPIVGDTGGSTAASAFRVGVLDGSLRLIDAWVGPQDAADRLAFHINSSVDLDFDFEMLGNDTEIRLFDNTGALRASMVPEVGAGNGFTLRLDPGAYNLSVVQISGATDVTWRTQSGVVSEGLIITGSTLAETIRGTALNDTLIGRAGADTLDGGAGNDFVHYFLSPTAVSVNLLTGIATGGEGTDTLLGIEGIAGSRFADTLRGNNSVNNLLGEGGNDRIEGNGGNDLIDGGAGIDTMLGGDGNDKYYVDVAGDVTTETNATAAGGKDLVVSSVSRVLGLNLENLNLSGAVAIAGTGNTLNNTINGAGNSASNLLRGLAGNDTYVVGVGDIADESLTGSSGIDTISSGLAVNLSDTTRVKGAIENLVLTGTAAVAGVGNSLSNLLYGSTNSAANLLRGIAGNDTYVVGIGDIADESFTGSTGIDTISSALAVNLSDTTRVKGAIEHLVLTGTGAVSGTGNVLNNGLTGNSANNILNGGLGNDVLNGGLGNDTLIGGAGSDFFIFNATLNASTNRDTISDFNAAADTIRLENAIFRAFAAVPVNSAIAAAAFKSNATGTATDADDRIIYSTTSGALFYDANGSAAGGAIQFATLTGRPVISHLDFVIV